MPSFRVSGRRAGIVAGGLALVVGMAACSAPDVVTTGQRPNAPTSNVSPPRSPETDPVKLALSLSSLPGFTAPTSEGAGVFSRPLVDARRHGHLEGAGRHQSGHRRLPPDPAGRVRRPVDLHHDPGRARPSAATTTATPRSTAPPTSPRRSWQVVWTHDTGDVHGEGSYWPGAGWTGQPLLVNWPAETKAAMGLDPDELSTTELRRGHLPRVRRQGLPARPRRPARGRKPPDRRRVRLQGHRLDRPARLPAAVRGHGTERRTATNGAVALPDLRPDPEQGGLRLGRPRRGTRLADWGAFDSSALVNAADRHPDRAGRERPDLQGEAQRDVRPGGQERSASTRRSPR